MHHWRWRAESGAGLPRITAASIAAKERPARFRARSCWTAKRADTRPAAQSRIPAGNRICDTPTNVGSPAVSSPNTGDQTGTGNTSSNRKKAVPKAAAGSHEKLQQRRKDTAVERQRRVIQACSNSSNRHNNRRNTYGESTAAATAHAATTAHAPAAATAASGLKTRIRPKGKPSGQKLQ